VILTFDGDVDEYEPLNEKEDEDQPEINNNEERLGNGDRKKVFGNPEDFYPDSRGIVDSRFQRYVAASSIPR
jgi:hypothetical protein